MRAVRLHRPGPPESLRWEEIAEPQPGPGEVRVRVEAVGVNYAEVLSRKGLYGWSPSRPYTLGMEAVGTIDAVGPGVDRRSGERVMVGTQCGAYAERVVVPSPQALPSLPSFTLPEEAAYPVNYLTAWVGLMTLGRAESGQRVTVSPAAGGVGTAAVQLAHAAGCEVVALSRTEARLARLRERIPVTTVAYGEEGFAERLREAVGPRGVDVSLEMVGGTVFRDVLAVMAPFGRVVVAGYASLDYRWWNPVSLWRAWRGIPRVPLRQMFTRSLGFHATHLGYLLDDPPRLAGQWSELVRFTGVHGIRPQVGAVLPAARVAEAHALMESRTVVGKIVLEM